MIGRRAAVICAALIAVMFAAGAWALLHVGGGPIATHFNAYGRPNGWATPARAFFTHPVIAMAVWVLLALLPRIDPRGANLARSEAAYGTIWIALTALLCVQQGAADRRVRSAAGHARAQADRAGGTDRRCGNGAQVVPVVEGAAGRQWNLNRGWPGAMWG